MVEPSAPELVVPLLTSVSPPVAGPDVWGPRSMARTVPLVSPTLWTDRMPVTDPAIAVSLAAMMLPA